MAPPCKNPMKTHMQRRSWLTDRLHTHIHTLSRPCDLGHGHGKTSQSGPSTGHRYPSNDAEAETEPRNHECAPENVIATQRNCTFSCVSQHINTSENLARRSVLVVLHSVATHIDKDQQRPHVMGTAQDADKEAYVRGREELRQNTRRTDASEHQLSVSSPMRKKNNTKSFTVQRCANTKEDPHGTSQRHKQTNFTSPYGMSRRGIVRNLTHRPCLSNDDVSKRHDKSLLDTQIMTDAWPHTTCFRSWHDTCTTLESIPRRHELTHKSQLQRSI